jgi:hypothetical protein
MTIMCIEILRIRVLIRVERANIGKATKACSSGCSAGRVCRFLQNVQEPEVEPSHIANALFGCHGVTGVIV